MEFRYKLCSDRTLFSFKLIIFCLYLTWRQIQMDHRREELEKKRAKLAELRRQREERKRAAVQAREQTTTGGKMDSQDINDLVNSLVGDRARSPTGQLGLAGAARQSRETLVEGRDRSISTATSIGTQIGSPDPGAATPGLVASPNPAAAAVGGMAAGPRILPDFKVSSMVIFDFPPKEKIVYNKEMQTADNTWETDEKLLSEEEIERRVQEIREADEKARATKEEEHAKREAEARSREAEIKRLTDEQRSNILESSEFASFMGQRSRVME
ncbi:hypothetical protein GGF47_005994, partial [Coemansia sp. RSA 2524]